LAEGVPCEFDSFRARLAGVVALAPGDAPDTLDLHKLFVEPCHIRGGIGRALLAHAVAEVRQRGAERLTILADPNAAGFYVRSGAVRIGEAPSDAVPGHFGVELHGSIQLVRDDLDVVDPLEHIRLSNFVDRIPAVEATGGYAPTILPCPFSRLVKDCGNACCLSPSARNRCAQIETSRPISTTASTGSLKYSVR
jgi:hypothetical protein